MRKRRDVPAVLSDIYRRLVTDRGPARWWPGETALEICLGAILTQNTSWSNVEKAIENLRRIGALEFEPLRRMNVRRLASLLRPSGYFNVKARRVRAFIAFLAREYGGDARAMRHERPVVLRSKLLAVHGIGRETADSIVLYAAGLPLFVVDAYTRRIFARLGLIGGAEDYDTVQAFFMRHLPARVALYNDFHAQVVLLGKDVCRPRPRCGECPLDGLCAKYGVTIRRRPTHLSC